MNRYFRARIGENIPLKEQYRLLSLIVPGEAPEPLPGQFYMLEVTDGLDPLLKRAFSLFRKTTDGFQILYKITGKGTSMLGSLKEGTALDVLGPLGKPYPLPSSGKIPLIVAGGIGFASVYPLITRLSKRAYVFYGGRTRDELFLLDELRAQTKKLFLASDDGSLGERGTVVDIVRNYLESHSVSLNTCVLYACGPKPMLKELARMSDKFALDAYVSLEEYMACGVGACLGCVVAGRKKVPSVSAFIQEEKGECIHKRVCTEGPVFHVREILW